MINETEEFDTSSQAIVNSMREYGFDYELSNLSPEDTEAVAGAIRHFMELSEDARELFLKGLRAFVCGECGAPTCLCGYSDE